MAERGNGEKRDGAGRREMQEQGNESATTEETTSEMSRKVRKYRSFDITAQTSITQQKRYYMIEFNEQTRRSVNPYAIVDKITEVPG